MDASASTSQSRRTLVALLAFGALAAAAVVAAIVVTGGPDSVVVAKADGTALGVREGQMVRVEGVVRDADYSEQTGSTDGIAFETDNVVFADSISETGDERRGAGLDLDGPELRGERVVVIGEVAAVADDRRSAEIDLD